MENQINLTEIAIGVIVLGVVVAVGAVVLIGVRDSSLTSLPVVTATNESFNSMTQIPQTLTKGWITQVSACVNATSGMNIGSGNWTLTIDNTNFGTATIAVKAGVAQPGVINNTNWKCSYNYYNTSQADWATADKAATGLLEYGNWFKILVIVAVAGVVLALLFLAFGNKGGSVGGASGSSGVAY